MSLPQTLADLDEERVLRRYLGVARKPSDPDPILDVRPSSRGGAERLAGRSLLHEVAVDVLVLAWFVATELVSRARRRSPRGNGE